MREAGVSSLDLINGDAQHAREELLRCCGSRGWVKAMLRHRPFRNAAHLYQCASSSWRGLKREDWLEACSSGKSGAQMLALLRERLANDAQTELAVAAGEQEKITRLRLEKLVCP